MTSTPTPEIVANSDAYYITRTESPGGRYGGGRTTFSVFEPEVFWPDSTTPRASIEVVVYHPEPEGSRDAAQVSWPSTSDKRPLLARALSDALYRAAHEAEILDADAYYADRSGR